MTGCHPSGKRRSGTSLDCRAYCSCISAFCVCKRIWAVNANFCSYMAHFLSIIAYFLLLMPHSFADLQQQHHYSPSDTGGQTRNTHHIQLIRTCSSPSVALCKALTTATREVSVSVLLHGGPLLPLLLHSGPLLASMRTGMQVCQARLSENVRRRAR